MKSIINRITLLLLIVLATHISSMAIEYYLKGDHICVPIEPIKMTLSNDSFNQLRVKTVSGTPKFDNSTEGCIKFHYYLSNDSNVVGGVEGNVELRGVEYDSFRNDASYVLRKISELNPVIVIAE